MVVTAPTPSYLWCIVKECMAEQKKSTIQFEAQSFHLFQSINIHAPYCLFAWWISISLCNWCQLSLSLLTLWCIWNVGGHRHSIEMLQCFALFSCLFQWSCIYIIGILKYFFSFANTFLQWKKVQSFKCSICMLA